MKKSSKNQAAATTDQARPNKEVPRWEQIAAEHRQALIITLTEIMVKRLPGQSKAGGGVDG
jgi:hypothetical protein